MPSYLHPGVYVEEIPSGAKPIEGVGTSTAMFIGYTTRGSLNEPVPISKWDDYQQLYGGYRDTGLDPKGDAIAYAVAAFFQNGGTQAYIARLAVSTGTKPLTKAAGWQQLPGDANKVLLVTAINEGQWANGITVLITSKGAGGLYLVEIGRVSARGIFQAEERFNDVSFETKSPRFVESVINGFSSNVSASVKAKTDPLVTGVSIAPSYRSGASVSGDLTDADLDFTTVPELDRTLNIAVDGGTAVAVILPSRDYSGKLAELASFVEGRVRGGEAPTTARGKFTAYVKGVDVLVLQSNTRTSDSAVVVTGDACAKCRLGAGAGGIQTKGVGTSISGTLAANDMKFSAVNDPDRVLSITLDGAAPFNITLEKLDYDLASLANDIQTKVTAGQAPETPRARLTAFPKDGDKLVLQSNSSGVSSVTVAGTAAAKCKLGTANGGTETAGGGTSMSGSLAAADLDFSTLAAPARTLTLALDGAQAFQVTLPAANYTSDLNTLAARIQALVMAHGSSGPEAKFTCRAMAGKLQLVSNTGLANSAVVVANSGAAAKCRLGVANGGVEATGSAAEAARLASGPIELGGGSDGDAPTLAAYENFLTKLKKHRDINILCLPGQEWKGTGKAVLEKAIAHAEEMRDRLVLVDIPSGVILNSENDVQDLSLSTSTYAVTYYPWIRTVNVLYDPETQPGAPDTVLVPPSGYVAGMWARIDSRRGVWKAPAGVETGLSGVAGLEATVGDVEQDALNPLGVNCLRKLPGFGPVIWGARTLSTKAQPEWRYVPVRRTAIYIERSLYEGIQWAVFEGNDHPLWSSLRANITSFMDGLFRAGAFQGQKASDAYFVRCGLGDTMTQDDIDRGQVVVVVGFAPLKPAEFVIIRLQQKVNQS